MTTPAHPPKGALGTYAQAVLDVLTPHFPDLTNPITAEVIGDAIQQHRTAPDNEDIPGRFLLAKGTPEALVQGESAAQDHFREVPKMIQMPKGAQRLQAASALSAFLNTPAWQQVVAAGDYRSGQQIVLALETDTFADLRPRVERCEPPVHVAVYRPSVLVAPRLHFLVLEPASPGFDPRGDVVDPKSTVGAFCTRQDRSVPARWQPHLVLRELADV